MAKHHHGRYAYGPRHLAPSVRASGHGGHAERYRPAHVRPPSRRRIPLILICSFVLVGALLSLSNATAMSKTSRFIPRADAYVSQAKPNGNFGSSRTLRTNGLPKLERGYLRFDVTQLTGTVIRAMLRLYADSRDRFGYKVRSVPNGKWTENGITYANAPTPGPVVAVSGAVARDTWTSVDVTAMVRGDGSVSLAVTADGSSAGVYASREAGRHAPRLVVETLATTTTTSPATTTTAASTTTSASSTSTATSTPSTQSTSAAAPTTTNPPTGSPVPTGFVYRNGKTLLLDGHPYKFAGFNAYGMSGCETGSAWSKSMLDDYFSNLPSASMTRTWAFSAYGTSALDQIVASAAAHDQKLILSLADGNSNCRDYDGSPGGEGTGKNTSWYVSGYKTNYLDWVRTVVSRYKDSPAVGMWEIINEPGHTGGKVDEATMRAFFDVAAATIKGIDQRHLVESGALGEYVSGTTDYAYVHGGPNVDVGSLHEYEYEYDHSNTIVSEHFSPTLTAMSKIDKPLIVGETGILAGPNCQTSPDTRAEAMKKKLDAYLSSGAAGLAVWNRSSRSYQGCDYGFDSSDPLNARIKGYIV